MNNKLMLQWNRKTEYMRYRQYIVTMCKRNLEKRNMEKDGRHWKILHGRIIPVLLLAQGFWLVLIILFMNENYMKLYLISISIVVDPIIILQIYYLMMLNVRCWKKFSNSTESEKKIPVRTTYYEKMEYDFLYFIWWASSPKYIIHSDGDRLCTRRAMNKWILFCLLQIVYSLFHCKATRCHLTKSCSLFTVHNTTK